MLGDIEALNNMGIVQGIGAIVLIIVLSNTTSIIKLIRSITKKTHKESVYTKMEIKAIVDNAIRRAIEIFTLKEYKTLTAQMLCVEKTTDIIKSLILDNFQDMPQLDGQKNKGRDIRAFSKIIEYTFIETKATMKEWIRSNHILSRSELEFKVYVKETVRGLLVQVSSIIDKEYLSDDFIVDRETLKKHNIGTLTAQIADLLQTMLFTIRDIAIEKDKEIKELEAESFFIDGESEDREVLK